MQLINLVVLGLFALILLGIYSTSYHARSKVAAHDDSHYWSKSILLRAGAYICWILQAFSNASILVIGTACYVASFLLLILYMRSWYKRNGYGVKWVAFLYWVLHVCLFVWFVSMAGNNFVYRAWLGSGSTMLLCLAELMVVLKYRRCERNSLLNILLGVVVLQAILTAMSLVMLWVRGVPQGSSLTDVNINDPGMIMLWITLGTHLLSYITISSFLYKKMWDSERVAHEKLKQQSEQLRLTTDENLEIRQLLQERERLIDRLIQANKTTSTGAMAASIAHEMAQPLAVIGMNAEFLDKLSQEQTIPPELLHQMLSGIRTNNEHAANIIGTLRGIFLDKSPAKVESNLRLLVDKVVQLARSKLDQHRICLDVEIPENLVLHCYASEIFQVVVNLLNNAIQALASTPVGAGRIAISAQTDRDRLKLSIVDNGPGVPLDLQPRLFQLYEHGGKDGSMGLGLWLCAYILQRHDGSIHYEEAPGGGASFILELPLTTQQPLAM